MRCYKLIIGDEAAPKLKIQLDRQHPIAPRITFNIMRAEADVFVPSMISIFNLPLAYFSASQSLVGEKLQLFGGIEKTPTTEACKIEATGCKLLFTGYIWNILPDYDGTTCNITMFCGVSNVSNSKIAGSSNSIIEVAVPPNQSIGQGFSKFISKMLGSLFTVTATQAALYDDCHQNSTTSTTLLKYNDLKSCFQALSLYGLAALVQDNTVRIYSLKSKDDLSSSDIKIEPAISNFVSQPTWTTTSSISISLLMDATIAPMRTLSISQKIAIAPSSLVGDMSIVSAVKPSFSATSILGGDFRIVSVWHRGDSRGSDASSWVTELEAVSNNNRFTD